MKITKTLLLLLLSTVMFTAYADKPKKQDPLLTGPFFIQPYFNAFGMRVQEVDTTEARRGCVDIWEHQSARVYYFVSKKNAETSMEYTTGKSGFRIDNIKFHVYREYPTVEETEDFMWNEIPGISDKNQKALSAGSLSLGWADYVFGPSLLIPGIIDIFQLKQ